MRYTFGINEMAAERLHKVAQIFNPYSTEFISRHSRSPAASAVDLGCGPGYTTHMLYMASKAKETYGIDNSDKFLISAMEKFGQCVFVKHDLTKTPFFIKPDIMYSRFVLAHIPDPVAQLNDWAEELNENGIMLVEEIDNVETDMEIFNRYLSVNKELVAAQGAELFAGKTLANGAYDAELIVNESFELPVANADAAAMFYPNTVNIWAKESFVKNKLSAKERKDISDQLLSIKNSGDKRIGIVWKMRRIALKKSREDPYRWMFI